MDYFPHLYLGLSLEKSRRAKEAVEELEESKRQGVVLGKSGLTRILEAALRRLQPASGSVTPVGPVAVSPTAIPIPTPPTLAPVATRTPLSIVPSQSPTPRATAILISLPPSVPTRGDKRVTETTTPKRGVADGTRAGIRYFFDGDFSAAEKRLGPLADSLPVARLFLAYTMASQALLSGQSNGPLARNARAEYRKAQEQGAPRSTDALVSPSVRRLLAAE